MLRARGQHCHSALHCLVTLATCSQGPVCKVAQAKLSLSSRRSLLRSAALVAIGSLGVVRQVGERRCCSSVEKVLKYWGGQGACSSLIMLHCKQGEGNLLEC